MAAPTDLSQDPFTLRFADPDLESGFQAEMAATNGPQARIGALVAAGLWLVAALFIPTAVDIDPGVVRLVCGSMIVANLAGAIASRWATTLDRQQVVRLVLNGLAGLAVLALVEASGTSDR